MQYTKGLSLRKLIPLLILVSLALTLTWYFFRGAAEGDILSVKDNINGNVSNGKGSQRESQAQTFQANGELTSINKSSDPFPEIPKTRANIPIEKDIFGPQSKEEQQWLDRHGFPNAEQLSAYGIASDDILKQAARAGDKVAQMTLDLRSLRSGDKSAEERILKAAALDGNISGLLRMASSLGSSKTKGDAKRAFALTKVAEMFGDNKVGLTRDFMITAPLEQFERLEAEGDALRIFGDLIKMRKAKFGANVIIVDPRPLPPSSP